MPRNLFIVLLLVGFLVSIISCASIQGSSNEAVSVEVIPPAEDSEESADGEDTSGQGGIVEQEVEKVLRTATDLRHDGLRLAEEGNLEDARDALDSALNTILGSGLALDAHPRLFNLFHGISDEAIAIDEQLAQADEELQENTLADELDEVTAEEEVGENEEAPPAVTYDLPVVMNNLVRQFIERFQGERRGAFEEGIQRSGLYLEMFKQIMREEGIPTDLAYMPQIESAYKVKAFSRAKAKGIWQFMSWTGKRYGLQINWWIDERSDPESSCRAAARYLKDLYNELGDWLLAMAAYNGGPGRVSRAVRMMKTKDFWKIAGSTSYLRRETRNFVPAILSAIIIMKQPEAYGFGHVKPYPPLKYEKVTIDSPTDLRVVSELAGISVSQVQELNPALRRLVTPADYPNFELKLPPGTKSSFETKFAALEPGKRLKYTEHVVQRGETLSVIARRYATSVAAIQMANNISNPHKVKQGQHLLVPLSAIAADGISSTRAVAAGYPKGARISHRVQRGENLYTIALAYGTTVQSIVHWNNIDPRKPIYPGNQLTIYSETRVDTPAVVNRDGKKIVHSVQQGDTLYQIARNYKISVTQLKRWNNLRRNLIRPGDRLTIYIATPESEEN